MNNQTTSSSGLIIGIAGPSGSGKSFISEHLLASLPAMRCLLLSQDDYYHDRSDLPLEKRQFINYDHPDAIEFSLLAGHLRELRHGRAIRHPVYDFSVHNRKAETREAGPADVVIVDGILLFCVAEMLPLFDLKIYVDTPLDICFIRRLQRDVLERGRTMASVIQQYCTTVRPMFIEFVQASRSRADLVLSGEVPAEEVLPQILHSLRALNPSLPAKGADLAAATRSWHELLALEHGLMVRALALLQAEMAELEHSGVTAGRTEQLLNFLTAFGDRIHNVKEENHLFPLLMERGIPHDGLIKEMLLDHEAERELLVRAQSRFRKLEHAAKEERLRCAAMILEYCVKRREHIRMENEELFPRAEKVLAVGDAEKLTAGFAKVEEINLYPNATRHFSQMLEQWERAGTAGGKKR